MNPAYRWCIEEAGYDALASLKKRRQRDVLAAIRAIAAHPFQAPAFTTADSDGFEIAVRYAAGCMISYHIDHATRMVQVREVTFIA